VAQCAALAPTAGRSLGQAGCGAKVEAAQEPQVGLIYRKWQTSGRLRRQVSGPAPLDSGFP